MHSRTVLLPALLAAAASAPAQLNLKLRFSFVDNRAGGNGNIGVTQDEKSFHYYVLDFSNTKTVHEFDPAGKFLNEWPTRSCSPSSVSPNDITYAPDDDTLWLVDNNGNVVVHQDRKGRCLGGWRFRSPSRNPVGITYHRISKTLFISSQGIVSEWSTAGQRLAGGFSFRPPGTSILSGITHFLNKNRFLITQSGGSKVHEVDAKGKLISTTDLRKFGIGNTQGLHFSVLRQQLVVVDNSLSKTFVFDVTPCSGVVTRRGTGCKDPFGTPATMRWTGCPDLGRNLQLILAVGSSNRIPVVFLGGLSDRNGFGGRLPLDLGPLGAPGCSAYTSSELILGPFSNSGGGASVRLPVPNNPWLKGKSLHWQAVQAGRPISTPLPVVTSDYLTTAFN